MTDYFSYLSNKVKKKKKRKRKRIKMSMTSYGQDHPLSHFLQQSLHQDLG